MPTEETLCSWDWNDLENVLEQLKILGNQKGMAVVAHHMGLRAKGQSSDKAFSLLQTAYSLDKGNTVIYRDFMSLAMETKKGDFLKEVISDAFTSNHDVDREKAVDSMYLLMQKNLDEDHKLDELKSLNIDRRDENDLLREEISQNKHHIQERD